MDWLRRAARERPNAPAVITPERVITYAELDRAADVVATIVSNADLAAVAFWGERDPATVAAVWGIPRAGATAVPVDPAWPAADAMRLTREAGARGLWALPDGGIDRLLDRTPDRVTGSGPPESDSRFVVFTSGSEGRRRGAILTGANLEASVAGSRLRLGNGPDDVWLVVLPLFHVGGLSILWRQAEAGAPVLLLPRFEVEAVADALQRVAFASVVPTMLRRLLAAGVRGGPHLRGVLVGGGPADPALLQEAIDAGIPALQTYGMTETASQVCTVAPEDAVADLGTAGRPIEGAEVRVGDDGRIAIRGPMVSPGYLAESPREGDWFVAGDLGRIDSSGRLVVIGRADAVIVTGGENVHPASVEQAIRRVPGVVEVRVFGEPDSEWGMRVVAEVVLDGGDVATMADAVRSSLTPAEVPREWRVVDSLPTKLI